MKKFIELGQFIIDIELQEGTINHFMSMDGTGKTYLKYCIDLANEVIDTEMKTVTYKTRDTLDDALNSNPKLILLDRLDIYYDDFKNRLPKINEYLAGGGIVLANCNYMCDQSIDDRFKGAYELKTKTAFIEVRLDKETNKNKISVSNDMLI